MLGRNKRLQIPAKEYDDGPDLTHWEIHEALVEAARISPKTNTASDIFWGIFIDMPTTATEGAYIKDEALSAAVSAWNVEMSDNDQHRFLHLSESDAMTPAERVQFHLLRHYCSWIKFGPDDPNRVRRLAAYAKNPVVGEHGLVVGDFQKYSDRDGPAFVYATSLNYYIWRNKEASEAMRFGKFPTPKNTDDIYQNRAACTAAVDTGDQSGDKNESEEGDSVAAQTFKAVDELRAELSSNNRDLNVKIGRLRAWVFWSVIVLIGLLIFKH